MYALEATVDAPKLLIAVSPSAALLHTCSALRSPHQQLAVV
jgi:hypothetical protein